MLKFCTLYTFSVPPT